MKRTTIMLPGDLKARAERRARAEGVFLGELIPRALTQAVVQPASIAEDPLFTDDATYGGEALHVDMAFAIEEDDGVPAAVMVALPLAAAVGITRPFATRLLRLGRNRR